MEVSEHAYTVANKLDKNTNLVVKDIKYWLDIRQNEDNKHNYKVDFDFDAYSFEEIDEMPEPLNRCYPITVIKNDLQGKRMCTIDVYINDDLMESVLRVPSLSDTKFISFEHKDFSEIGGDIDLLITAV